jgi:threonine/homoserine/homoserine lactone efflux protein
LGARKFLVPDALERPHILEQQKLSKIFYQGVVVNVLNPKTALFFFAFLPQFVDAGRGVVALQIFLLGLIFVTMGIFSDGLYALLAGTAGDWLRGSLRFLKAQRYFAGGVFIALGVTAALSGSGKE